jgi:carbon monoxide dehydrogenase subunit G
VWEFIVNPSKIAKCLPELKSLELEGEDRFVATVRVGVGLIKGDFKFNLAIVEKQAPNRARLKGSGSGSGSSIDIDTSIQLAEVPNGTKLDYQADVKIGGIMAGLGQRLIGGATEQAMTQMFECVRTELEA